MDAYIPALLLMSVKYNITRVYLATDDQKVVKQAEAYADKFHFVSYDFDRDIMNSNQLIERCVYANPGVVILRFLLLDPKYSFLEIDVVFDPIVL